MEEGNVAFHSIENLCGEVTLMKLLNYLSAPNSGGTTCTRAKRGETLSTAMLNQYSICFTASVLYKNWQRPCAMVNANVQEFESCKLASRNEKASVYITSAKQLMNAILEGINYAQIVQ